MVNGTVTIYFFSIMRIKPFPKYYLSDFSVAYSALLTLCSICLFLQGAAFGSPLSEKSRIKVNRILFSGNTVFSDTRIAQLLLPFEKRVITAEELQSAAEKITRLYINNGYINSGAVIPDQKATDGIIRIRIIEGKLDTIILSGNSTIKESYIKERILPDGGTVPLNINDLRQRLKLLKNDPHIENLHARLSPGSDPGSASLHINIIEASRLRYGISVNNHASPGTGSYSVENSFAFLNLSGIGDLLSLETQFTKGLQMVSAGYSLPLTARDMIHIEACGSDSEVISKPFSSLDITGRSMLYALVYDHAFIQSINKLFEAEIRLEYYSSTTYLNNQRFSFSQNAENGRTTISAVKLSQDYIRTSIDQVLAMRLTESVGTDLINPTSGQNGSDGKFVSLKGQFQYLRRLQYRNSQLKFKCNFQLAADQLPPSERFTAGGAESVRGYRKYALDRDQGFETSLEFQIPLARQRLPKISRKAGEGLISIAPFIDYAKAGNFEAPHMPETISGAGLGILWDISKNITAELYGAKSLYSKDRQADYDLQDESIYFKVEADF